MLCQRQTCIGRILAFQTIAPLWRNAIGPLATTPGRSIGMCEPLPLRRAITTPVKRLTHGRVVRARFRAMATSAAIPTIPVHEEPTDGDMYTGASTIAAQTQQPAQAPRCPICHQTDEVRTAQAAFDVGAERIAPPAMPTSNARMAPWIVASFAIYLAGNFYLFVELGANSQSPWSTVVQVGSDIISFARSLSAWRFPTSRWCVLCVRTKRRPCNTRPGIARWKTGTVCSTAYGTTW